MNRKFLSIALLAMVSIGVFNCSTDLVDETELSAKERVAKAEIIKGEMVDKLGHIILEIPSTDGYVQFQVNSAEETREIVSLVYQRFKKEYDKAKAASGSGAEGGKVLDYQCGNWAPINSNDPNSYVYRYCFNFATGQSVRQTCECGYCACPEEPF